MAVVDLIMPKLGESIMEATILKWHKQPGDPVKMDETILEIATDKVDSEVPSTAEGVIEAILFNVNDVVPIGTPIARIRTGAAEPANVSSAPSAPAATSTASATAAVETAPVVAQTETASASKPAMNGTVNRFYSPLVLNIAAGEGVSMSELENIPGTGNEGRVTKKDILAYVEDRKSGKPVAAIVTVTDNRSAVSQPAAKADVITTSTQSNTPVFAGNAEIIEMDRMRKLIADHMVRSKHTSPHVTSFSEADVTNLVLWRERVKKDFEKEKAKN